MLLNMLNYLKQQVWGFKMITTINPDEIIEYLINTMKEQLGNNIEIKCINQYAILSEGLSFEWNFKKVK